MYVCIYIYIYIYIYTLYTYAHAYIHAHTGITGYDMQETSTNLALNIFAMGGLGIIYFNDKKAEDANLRRCV